MNYKFIKKNNQKAFVSMIALLLANVFLVIGLSVFNIALREVILSSGSKESLFAFYAADGGMECALYWDIQEDAFSTSTPASTLNCSEQNAIINTYLDCGIDGLDCVRMDFRLDYDSGACVKVDVFKSAEGNTIIRSFGQNSCDPLNQRKVERAWQVMY